MKSQLKTQRPGRERPESEPDELLPDAAGAERCAGMLNGRLGAMDDGGVTERVGADLGIDSIREGALRTGGETDGARCGAGAE